MYSPKKRKCIALKLVISVNVASSSFLSFSFHFLQYLLIFFRLFSYVQVSLFGLCRGYLAPEYALRGQVTRKADIYSFGILLLEIVSGRSNTNRRLPVEDQYLLERVRTL